MAKIVHAVAGILRKNDSVLIATRPMNTSYAGHWEFPGGKLELNETVFGALIRELEEEIGVITEIQYLKHFMKLEQEYPHLNVHLDVVLVEKWLNEPIGQEGQVLYWQNVYEYCDKNPQLIT